MKAKLFKITGAHIASILLMMGISSIGIGSTVYTYWRSYDRYDACINKVEKVLEIKTDIDDLNDVIVDAINGIGDPAENQQLIVRYSEKIKDNAESVPETFDVSEQESQDIYDRFKDIKSEYETSITDLMTSAQQLAGAKQALVEFETKSQMNPTEDPMEISKRAKQLVELNADLQKCNDDRTKKLDEYIQVKQRVTAIADDAVETSKKHKDKSQYVLKANAIAFSIFIGVLCIVNILIILALIKRENKKNQQLMENRDEIARAKHNITRIANSDLITNLPNRHAFNDYIDQEIYTDTISAGMIRINNVETIADTYGYDFADVLLMNFADKMTEKFRDIIKLFYINESTYIFLFTSPSNIRNNELIGSLWTQASSTILVNNVQITPDCKVAVNQFTKKDSSSDTIIKNLKDNIRQLEANNMTAFSPNY